MEVREKKWSSEAERKRVYRLKLKAKKATENEPLFFARIYSGDDCKCVSSPGMPLTPLFLWIYEQQSKKEFSLVTISSVQLEKEMA